jgi:hypothetical protein
MAKKNPAPSRQPPPETFPIVDPANEKKYNFVCSLCHESFKSFFVYVDVFKDFQDYGLMFSLEFHEDGSMSTGSTLDLFVDHEKLYKYIRGKNLFYNASCLKCEGKIEITEV